MEINPEEQPWKNIYKIMIGSILPRPIGWVSTVDRQGRPNLAPFSFFNAICANPPHVLFCPMVRSTDYAEKDTLRNIREVGEFVVNIVTEELAEQMNLSAQELPAEENEFFLSGLNPSPSKIVKPPRVAESPIHYECRLAQVIEIGDQPGSGSVVIGQVVHIHVDDSVLLDPYKIDLAKLRPIGRLAGSAYCRVTDVFFMDRPPSKILSKPTQQTS